MAKVTLFAHSLFKPVAILNHDNFLEIIVVFFQNVEILFQLDELGRISNAWIGFNYSLTQAEKKKHSRVMVRVGEFFCKIFLLNLSN